MEVYETDDLTDNLLSYFRRRHYLDGDTWSKPELNVTVEEMMLNAIIDKDSSSLNSVSCSSVIQDLVQAESQFSLFKNWVVELGDEGCELNGLVAPLGCHIFLDALRTHSKQTVLSALHSILPHQEWPSLVELILALPSMREVSSYPLLQTFRSSKCEIKIKPKLFTRLKKVLVSKNLYIILQVMNYWISIEIDEPSLFEEDFPQDYIPPQESEEVEDDFEEEDYLDINDSEMEELVTEIQRMRSQPTPPPPLLLYTAHRTQGIVCGRVSGDGKLAATGDQGSEVRVWGLGETKLTPQLHADYFSSARLSTFTQPLHDTQQHNDKQWWSLRGHSDTVYDVAFIADHLLSVSFDTTMRLWSMNDFSCAAVYRGHSKAVWGVAVCPVHNLVATGSCDKTARVWSLDRTFPLRILAGHLQDVLCVSFHPNGSYVATGSVDRTVRLWSVTDGSMVRVLGGLPEQGAVSTVVFSPNGQYAASAGNDKYVWLWDLAGGSLVYQLESESVRIVGVDWSHDGSTVSACTHDGTVYLWSLDDQLACNGGSKPKKYATKCSTLLSLQYSSKNTLVGVGLA